MSIKASNIIFLTINDKDYYKENDVFRPTAQVNRLYVRGVLGERKPKAYETETRYFIFDTGASSTILPYNEWKKKKEFIVSLTEPRKQLEVGQNINSPKVCRECNVVKIGGRIWSYKIANVLICLYDENIGEHLFEAKNTKLISNEIITEKLDNKIFVLKIIDSERTTFKPILGYAPFMREMILITGYKIAKDEIVNFIINNHDNDIIHFSSLKAAIAAKCK